MASKIIWTYWNSAELPALVQACILSWKHFHPDFEVRVLDDVAAASVIGFDLASVKWVDSPQRASDVVRVNCVARHGGVWLDASFLLSSRLPLVDVVAAPDGGSSPDFAGWYLQSFTKFHQWPVLESWAFAARPGSAFMAAWRDEFMSTPNVPEGVADKLRAYKGRVDAQHIDNPHYLFIHMAAQAVLQSQQPFASPSSMLLLPAEQGPYKYLVDVDWKSKDAAAQVLSSFHPRLPAPRPYPCYKLRSEERKYMSGKDQASVLRRVQYAIIDDSVSG
jgi:hypothetical protein